MNVITDSERIKGYMQTTWQRTLPASRETYWGNRSGCWRDSGSKWNPKNQ